MKLNTEAHSKAVQRNMLTISALEKIGSLASTAYDDLNKGGFGRADKIMSVSNEVITMNDLSPSKIECAFLEAINRLKYFTGTAICIPVKTHCDNCGQKLTDIDLPQSSDFHVSIAIKTEMIFGSW